MKVYRTDEIRNVVLLGHGGSGKTSLAEAMLLYQEQSVVWERFPSPIRPVILIKKSRSADSRSARA